MVNRKEDESLKNKEEILKQAFDECVDDDMKKVVYDEDTQEFSFLKISSAYKKMDDNSKYFDPEFPNVCKYNILTNTYWDGQPRKELWLIENEQRGEKIVQILKKVHGITDPWDNDPDYFKTHKPGEEL